ncbi:hypothetical protein FF098_015265 [Parvularcula flava]|uniref:Uncharacterized protein n=1 Tax=Aquisalinus luteolus TaxID=1566827 RepID=A0A8J3A4F2_9PROT|nr:hypothetical protein [Aquisalinus luteolus]NHK29277.1 hypothetical protein [Aquisalinus luteolus]GGI01265.1 hypothetical protein GCM10011355_31500 [Aquisalinus luteolus]
MLSQILNDLGTAISMVLDFNNIFMVIAILVISVFTGLRMGNYGNIFGAVMESTVLLAIVTYLWNWLSTPGRFNVDVWESETILAWNNLMGLTGMALVGYLCVFFILVSAVYIIKAIASR